MEFRRAAAQAPLLETIAASREGITGRTPWHALDDAANVVDVRRGTFEQALRRFI